VNAAYKRKQYSAAFYLLYDLTKSLLEEVAITKGILPAVGTYTLGKINDTLHKSHIMGEEDYKTVKKLVVARNRMIRSIDASRTFGEH
jgi:hypothetical protein